MICDAYFYNLPFDKGSNIRIMTSSALVSIANSATGSQSQKAKKMVLNLPSNFDRVATFYADVPTDEYPIECNYAVVNAPLGIDRSTCHFWVTRPESVANDKGVLRIYFERDPVPDVRHSVKGVFSALPTPTNPYQRVNTAATLMNTRKTPLLTRMVDHEGDRIVWVEITTNRDIYVSGGKDAIKRYGMFMSVKEGKIISPRQYNSSGTYIPSGVFLTLRNLMHITYYAPNTEFTADNIIDIAVCEYCPFQYAIETRTEDTLAYLTIPDEFLDPAHQGETIPMPVKVVSHGGQAVTLYEYNDITINSFFVPVIHDVDIALSDNEKTFGACAIYDTYGNIAGSIPHEVSESLKVCIIGDTSGINTYIYNEETGFRLTISNGHIPFTSSAWQNYQALSLNYDREMMKVNQDKANAEAANSVGTGIANGVVTGALLSGTGPLGAVGGIATAGISVISTLIGRNISITAEKDAQKIKEEYQKIQVGNTYNAGYGSGYIDLVRLTGGCYIGVMMPKDIDDDFIDNYVKIYGYPAVGLRTVTLSKGYYQGYVIGYANNTNIDKLVLSILNDELSQGIRIIESRDDI